MGCWASSGRRLGSRGSRIGTPPCQGGYTPAGNESRYLGGRGAIRPNPRGRKPGRMCSNRHPRPAASCYPPAVLPSSCLLAGGWTPGLPLGRPSATKPLAGWRYTSCPTCNVGRARPTHRAQNVRSSMSRAFSLPLSHRRAALGLCPHKHRRLCVCALFRRPHARGACNSQRGGLLLPQPRLC